MQSSLPVGMRPKRRNPEEVPVVSPQRKKHSLRPCDQQEAEGAAAIGGRRTRGSGCGSEKGDFKTRLFLGEAKTTGKESFSIKREMLCKITREAREEGKLPVFMFGFDGMESAVWMAIPASKFQVVCRVLSAVVDADLEEAKRWASLL